MFWYSGFIAMRWMNGAVSGYLSWIEVSIAYSCSFSTGVLIMVSEALAVTFALPDCWRQRMKLMSNWGAVKNPPNPQVAEETNNASWSSSSTAMRPAL